MFLKKTLAVSILTTPFLMSGCGGEGADDSNSAAPVNSAGFTLALTDGPVDSAAAVVIEVTGVSIKPKDGDLIKVEFDSPMSIDVLQLQDGVAKDLISNLDLEAGEYKWVQLHLNAAEDGVFDSYIEYEDGTQVELDLPSDSVHGLRVLRNFTLVEGEAGTFTIDFDLRRSLIRHRDSGRTTLKPVLHMIPNHRAGSLRGTVDATLVAEMCDDPSTELGAVYVFSGADAMPTDVNGSESDPVTSAMVKVGRDGDYRYHLGFLEEGEYTVAYTCDAASDNVDEVNELDFAVLEPVTIAARKEFERPFHRDAPHRTWDRSVCDDAAPPSDEVSADENDGTEGKRSLPMHLSRWCEMGEHEWHPRPGKDGEHEVPEFEKPEFPKHDETTDGEERPDRGDRPDRGERPDGMKDAGDEGEGDESSDAA